MTDQPLLLVYTKKDNDELGLARNIVRGEPVLARTVSRLRFNPDAFHFAKGAETVSEIQALPSQRLSWEDCCFQRAQDLLRLNKDHYFISYSGGIDSTAILVSLLETWPRHALEKVTVLLSKSSVEENPNFFNRVVENFKIETSVQEMSSRLVETRSLLVTGEAGDQLFGSVVLSELWEKFGSRIFTDDYQEMAKIALKDSFERFAPIVEESPIPIRSAVDFFWWLNFTQKWQFVKYRFMQSAEWDLRAQYGEHVLHFYDSVAFQQWSLENHDRKIQKTWDSYKFIVKEFIYKYTRDPEQLKLRKLQSLFKTFTLTEKRMAITPAYKSIATLNELRDYVR
jgi:hypothetical protein